MTMEFIEESLIEEFIKELKKKNNVKFMKNLFDELKKNNSYLIR